MNKPAGFLRVERLLIPLIVAFFLLSLGSYNAVFLNPQLKNPYHIFITVAQPLPLVPERYLITVKPPCAKHHFIMLFGVPAAVISCQ